MPTPHNKGKAVQTRDGSSASPTQGLGCQRQPAPYRWYAPGLDARGYWKEHWVLLAELPVFLRQPQAIRPPSVSLLLADDDPLGSLALFSCGVLCCKPVASPGPGQPRASPSALLHSLIFGPWCACRAPQAIRSCKPASAALLLLILLSLSPNLALGLQARPPPRPQCAKRAQWLPPCTASSGETARWWSSPGWR